MNLLLSIVILLVCAVAFVRECRTWRSNAAVARSYHMEDGA